MSKAERDSWADEKDIAVDRKNWAIPLCPSRADCYSEVLTASRTLR